MEKRIDIKEFRGTKSTLFTGRPQGMLAREKLNLDELDREEGLKVIFLVPKETTSFNPSFYLGFLFDSYKHLGFEGFSKKYSFELLSDSPTTRKVLQKNLDEGKKYAFNELNKRTGLSRFFKS